MNLANYYKGAPPPKIKKKNKILIFAKKALLFCVFRIIDFIFWIKKQFQKLFTHVLRLTLTTYGLFLFFIWLFSFGLIGVKNHFDKILNNKFISTWLKK